MYNFEDGSELTLDTETTDTMKKAFAVVLSASMVMEMFIPALADTTVENGSGDTDVTALIYSLDIDKVVVASAYEVAFNPEELTITTGTGDTSTDQILSRNFGIINQSSKAKIVTISLNVANQNTDAPIQFVGSAADIASADMNDYAIYLEAVPADTTEVKGGITPASADKTTAAADLKNVTMTKATTAAVPLSAEDNELQFVRGKATYTPIRGSEVTLGTSTGNNVASNYELTGLAASGKEITAFTLTGSMNKTAEWHKLTAGIKITPTYTLETMVDSTETSKVISGTGVIYDSLVPRFVSSDVGEITYTKGSGDDALVKIKSITMLGKDGAMEFDGYHTLGSAWAVAQNDEANGVINFDTKYIAAFAKDFPDNTTKAATVTYETADGTEKTATVQLL